MVGRNLKSIGDIGILLKFEKHDARAYGMNRTAGT